MASMFDQYNQQVQKGPENDYSQALGLVAPKPSGSPNWAQYQGNAGNGQQTGKDIASAASSLFGSGGSDTSGNQMSVSPDAAPLQKQNPALGQESPQSAMGMVAPKSSTQPQWANYGGGGGSGGGGGDMSSVASIAMAFI